MPTDTLDIRRREAWLKAVRANIEAGQYDTMLKVDATAGMILRELISPPGSVVSPSGARRFLSTQEPTP